jgi:hypothetical protein
MINTDNQKQFVVGVDFAFGSPQSYSDAEGRNTAVTVQPLEGDAVAFPETVYYERLNISILNNLPDGIIKEVVLPVVPFTLSSVIDRINTALGLNLTTDEIVDKTITTVEDSYTLTINEATSLGWLGSITLYPRWPGDPIPLKEVVLTRNLVLLGLTFPGTASGD